MAPGGNEKPVSWRWNAPVYNRTCWKGSYSAKADWQRVKYGHAVLEEPREFATGFANPGRRMVCEYRRAASDLGEFESGGARCRNRSVDSEISNGDLYHPIRIKRIILDRFLMVFEILFNNCSADYEGRKGEEGYYVIARKLSKTDFII